MDLADDTAIRTTTVQAADPHRYILEGDDDPRPILVVLHQESSTPGRVGQILDAHGVAVDIRRPILGEALPETLEGHRGAIVFGGPPSANDADDYIRREIDWLDVPLAEKRPFLGICLGAQMLVKHLGGTVSPHPQDLVEVGYYPLQATPQGRQLMPHWPEMVYQWHREGFDLPRDATLLAAGDRFPHQAFAYGPSAYGVQFHAELTLAMMHRWTTRGHARTLLPGAQQRRAHFDGRAIYDAPVRRWLEEFLARIFGRPA
ncbi:glutamine amidotransferase [Mangrovibrevibacter kandeliae]|uniref:glutamine amidotransferase n=1 Tax=Mangrovibrevibacter kandeliae TaxID=2968473 RepID=UPI0021192542|nr:MULTISPECIES: glutamine amidotransferase [unclassified Aurantimonas]MCQ8781941.1 glutamine amidotransferase [Aurantimonas sp. CSK15Z-1]MCW4115401.1 glutamine amidotransferase [Aurantimonas sp. MSK8Z-1]